MYGARWQWRCPVATMIFRQQSGETPLPLCKPKTKTKTMENQDIIEAINAAKRAGQSQAAIARAAGINDTYLSRFCSGQLSAQYMPSVVSALRRWMACTPEQPEAPAASRTVETRQFHAVRSVLALAESTTGMAQILHAPGAGASFALRDYILSSAQKAECMPVRTGSRLDWEVLRLLRQRFGKRGEGSAKQTSWEAITSALEGTGRVLILDGAHRLSPGALRILLDVREHTGLRLVFVGTSKLVLPPCPVRTLEAAWENAEVAALARAHMELPIDDEPRKEACRAVRSLLHLPGGLHNLVAVATLLPKLAADGIATEREIARAAKTLDLPLPASTPRVATTQAPAPRIETAAQALPAVEVEALPQPRFTMPATA
jgi:hypothetical protein